MNGQQAPAKIPAPMPVAMTTKHPVNYLRHLLMVVSVLALSACGGGDSADSGGGQSMDASECVGLSNLGQTLRAGAPVPGNNDFRLFNTCNFSVNARLYSAGHVSDNVSTLAPGASTVDHFFVSAGAPSVFACQVPSRPSIAAGGQNKRCL